MGLLGVTRRSSTAVSHKCFPMGRARKGLPWSVSRKSPPHGRSRAKAFHWPSQAMAEPADSSHRATHPRHGRSCRRHGTRPNRIKASLSVFQRWEVKVLGFGVKARLRPQRIASRGCSDPFALVGAIGKACGEAWVCVFLGSPPGCGGVLPLCVGGVGVFAGWCVGVVHVLTALMC